MSDFRPFPRNSIQLLLLYKTQQLTSLLTTGYLTSLGTSQPSRNTNWFWGITIQTTESSTYKQVIGFVHFDVKGEKYIREDIAFVWPSLI